MKEKKNQDENSNIFLVGYFEIMVDLEARTTQDSKFTNFTPNLYILEKTFHLLNKKNHCPQCENLAPLFSHQIVRVYS